MRLQETNQIISKTNQLIINQTSQQSFGDTVYDAIFNGNSYEKYFFPDDPKGIFSGPS